MDFPNTPVHSRIAFELQRKDSNKILKSNELKYLPSQIISKGMFRQRKKAITSDPLRQE